jgi:hypothetical protein
MRLCCVHLRSQPWRIRRAEAWVEGRLAAEQLLIAAATLDAANELARGVAKWKGAAWLALRRSEASLRSTRNSARPDMISYAAG